ncbi:MAG: AraC family transcriptional regulator [Proteobacteria bacterium]|nr:AraC family transcriptional regulator [Pseudomonadota bacterium]
MKSELQPRLLIDSQFDRFEELAGLISSWDADFRQLNAELFKPEIFQAQIGSMLISNARFGCHVNQQGATPPGMRTFALPETGCSELFWFGHSVAQGVLLSFPKHGEIQAYNRPGFNMFTFSIPEDQLSLMFEQNGGINLQKALGPGETIIPAPVELLDCLRDSLRKLQMVFRAKANAPALEFQCSEIHSQVLSCLLRIIAGLSPLSRVPENGSRHTVGLALDYINYRAVAPIRLAELCVVTGVSERTLQNHFKRELGMTPKTYMLGQRLTGVHHQLWAADPKNTLIADVANAWGFWHMGQFAADYKKIFKELPSATLRQGS